MEKEEMFGDEVKSICDDGSWSPQETRSSDDPSKLIISFDNYTSTGGHHHHLDQDYSLTSELIINFSSSNSNSCPEKIPPPTRSPLQAQEHVMAERKRRHNLSQLFISLSKLVPRLNKLDKASLLEDGIKYLKKLEERVRVLEEEQEMKTSKDDDSCGPEIEARIWDKHVLIKVFCNKEMELMARSIAGNEMDKIHLNLMDIRIMPFGVAALHITILAQMKSEFKGTVKDIVDHLHALFLNPTPTSRRR